MIRVEGLPTVALLIHMLQSRERKPNKIMSQLGSVEKESVQYCCVVKIVGEGSPARRVTVNMA